jgi:hypothetical protein
MMLLVNQGDWTLFHKDGEAVFIGDVVTSFRGDKAIVVGGSPPHHSGSSGRVFVDNGDFYPSVFDLYWEKEA